MKFLKEYKGLKEFNEFVEDLHIENWCIYNATAEDRILKIKNRPYFCKLSDLAKSQNLSVQNTEIVSWLDTLNQLYYVFECLNEYYAKLIIIQELEIPASKKRADYVLFMDNKALILEFSFNKWAKEYQFESKLHQAIHYKELMSNVLPSHIEIGTYTFIVDAECDKEGNAIYKTSEYSQNMQLPNYDKQFELAQFIENFFMNTKLDAYNELFMRDYYMHRHKENTIII